jgi:PIN domain nuclease of toxin-antitoxin system
MAKSMDTMARNRWSRCRETGGHHRARYAAYLPILPAHVFRAAALPLHHRDPFDRLLIAQALTEGFALVTREDFSAYGVTTSW